MSPTFAPSWPGTGRSLVGSSDIQRALQTLGLNGSPICVHSSLRSFGYVEGGPDTVIDAALAEGCTILVPSFSDAFEISPPPDMRPVRNGWDYAHDYGLPSETDETYSPASPVINKTMGSIPRTLLGTEGRVRGNHQINSFAAVGPLAHPLIDDQRPNDVYAPLRALADADGHVVLMGVGLESMTALHLAEQMAGRTLFKRWALDQNRHPMMVDIGSCSHGFPNFDRELGSRERRATVGESLWRVYPLKPTLETAANLIRANPEITRCANKCRQACNDAIAGGPILD